MTAANGPRWQIETLAALEADRDAWTHLAETVIDPNPFYTPDYLSASRALGQAGRLRLLVARSPTDPHRILALFPLMPAGLKQAWLPGLLVMAQNAYTPLTTPLVSADAGPDLFGSLLDSVPRLLPRTTLMIPIAAERRPFWQAFRAALDKGGYSFEITQRHDRAAIETDLDFAAYTGRHNRSLLRRERKLLTHGRLNYVVVEGRYKAGRDMLEAFLTLEAKGWKGRRGTALASRPETLRFARQAFAGEAPDVLFECLFLNDKPLAINVNLMADGVIYTVKSAFDEDYRGYSPGNLLDRHTIALATAGGAIRRVDSCANAGHPLEQHWHEREPIATIIVDWNRRGQAHLSRMAARLDSATAMIRSLARWRDRLLRAKPGR